ncbi:protein mono-ADP-ribosyltransferase PARP14 [Tenrec ecaudatus]|uniref:protein mono-ADP-ribosyltransferase PARP14 n=1 Tax=Tenrec ecaudatus TaxID=94439 RepID=UPI003F5998D0
MAEPYAFPLLVQGSWGSDPPKNLRNKLLVYFQSARRSGGGECVIRAEPGSPGAFLAIFSQREVRQRVLEKENHELVWPEKETFRLTVQLPTSPEGTQDGSRRQSPTKESKTKEDAKDPGADMSKELATKLSLKERGENMEAAPEECENALSLIAFENLKKHVNDIMVILLVENMSGLSEKNNDFQVELIRDLDLAVVTFQRPIDIIKFMEKCATYQKDKQLDFSPRLLETTKAIRVENLPPGVEDYWLRLFFENPNHGGGRVESVQILPQESSAIVGFFDRKVLDTILTKKLIFNNMPLSIFPYYHSLGTALYGKEKPMIKLPAPLEKSVPLPLWKFLQKNKHLIEEMDNKMERYHCELTWDPPSGIVTIRPAATLINQGRPRIAKWSEDVSTAFQAIVSQYQVITMQVDPQIWNTIKDDFEDDKVLIEHDAVGETVTLVGNSEDVRSIEPQINALIASIVEKVRREEQSLKEKMAISPGKYSLLCLGGFLKGLHTQCPEVEISYDASAGHMLLKGPQVDVYKLKCNIQEQAHSMFQKSLQVPWEIFQFLKQIDSEEFSMSLFIAKEILAVYELEHEAVLLTCCSPQGLQDAEQQMTNALHYKRIDIEDRDVLKDKKWKGHIYSLHKKHNSPSTTVTIDEVTSDTKAEVIIAGLAREVKESYHLLFDFVEENTKIERLIELQSSLVVQYIRSEKKPIWSKVKAKKNVQVIFKVENKGKSVLLIGSKTKVLEGVKTIHQIQDSICLKTICINSPAARHFFQDKDRYYKGETKRRFGCFIELQEDEERADGGHAAGQHCCAKALLAPGVSLLVQRGDLTRFPVDVLVNAANEVLKHDRGLAGALSKAAGPDFQSDCDHLIKAKGRLPQGSAIMSKAGKLPCQHVIHAVGPRWDLLDVPWCLSLLRKVVDESLSLAEKHKAQSIAIPAISSGSLGFPLDQCAETIVLAIKENFQCHRDGRNLKEIYLVDSSEKTVEAFAKVVKTVFKATEPTNTVLPSAPAAASQAMPRNDPGTSNVLVSPEGLQLHLMKGDVQNVMTDVVVNSIPTDLGLDRGPLSRALLEKAGPQLQVELNQVGQGVLVGDGTILTTSGYNLHCQHVLHVVPPAWANNASSRKIMEDLITQCLENAEYLSVKSITFPAIGTGNLGFPKTVFAELIVSEVLKFSSTRLKAVEEVHFLLHPSDHENIQAFSDEFTKRRHGKLVSDKIPKNEDKQGLYGAVTSPKSGVHEMSIGPIIFQVASGDITKEDADVIVNSTAKGFNLKAGVSKAILEGAGQDVEKECAVQAQQSNNDYIITKGGLLKCKSIIHVIGGNDVKKSVTCILQECEKMNYASICLPAIGTGNAKQSPDKVAKAMMDAIEDFVKKGSANSVKQVKVVILLTPVLDVFYAHMKKREGPQSSSYLSMITKIASYFGFSQKSPKKQTPLVLEKKTESVIFQVCGEDEKSVGSAITWIQEAMKKEVFTVPNEDECIKHFDEEEYRDLNQLQRSLNITISLDPKKPLLEVSGVKTDVKTATSEIEKMIKKVREATEQETRAECISEFVEWQYNDKNNFYPFDKITNLKLEKAKKGNQSTVHIKINKQNYTVDLKANLATDAQGNTLPIQRINKAEAKNPENWSDMKQQTSCLVELQPSHSEYQNVASMFNQTCSNFKILKIERIQNPSLWNYYQAKKKTMDDKNGQTNNEKLLFHGTDAASLPHVNQNGFNRSYAGKNATAFGKGTYFAINANYSANNTYSRPDPNGRKYMYVVRVLTGLYTLGNASLIVPPPKTTHDPTDLYDTVTDNVNNPSLFVVFSDYQAYPEYLITFTQ